MNQHDLYVYGESNVDSTAEREQHSACQPGISPEQSKRFEMSLQC